MEPRFRRAKQSVPAGGRGLPGMPFEMEDPDGDEPRAARKARYGEAKRPWWRPAGTWGRAALAGAALIVFSAFAYAVHVAKNFLDHDARFRIAGTSNIQATGLTEVSRAEMLPVFGEDIGRNIFFVPLAERRKELEQIPWVQRATVMRFLPDQIRVSVVERQPVAFVRHGQQIGLVDANGVLLSMPAAMMAQHHYSFPVLTGIDAGDPLPSRKARMDVYERLIGALDANGQHYSNQISEIDLTDPEDARVMMPEQGTDILAHFGEDHFLERYERYKSHIGEWRQQYPKLAAVDLRYDQQVVLQMATGARSDAGGESVTKPDPGQPALVAATEQPRTDVPVKTKAAAKSVHSEKAVAPAQKIEAAKPVEHAKALDHPKTVEHAKAMTAHANPKSGVAEKKHTASKAKAESRAREARAEELARQMRERRREAARRAALHNSKKKTAAKPHTSATASRGQ